MEDYMSDLNIVCLIGRVTKNAELGMTGNSTPFCDFSIATHRSRLVGGEWGETAHTSPESPEPAQAGEEGA
jgi:single-stranded DNA-binding protein